MTRLALSVALFLCLCVLWVISFRDTHNPANGVLIALVASHVNMMYAFYKIEQTN